VAKRFLADVEMEPSVRQSCVELVQWFHESTAKASGKFKDELRRHNYVTPTSYLELITTFKNILKEKREEVMAMKNRYLHGYNSLISTESNVSKMQKELEDLQPKLIEASKETDVKEKIVETQANDAEKIRVVVSGEEAIA
jgi:dynein heavy chain